MEKLFFDGKGEVLQETDLRNIRKEMTDEIDRVEDGLFERKVGGREMRKSLQVAMVAFLEKLKKEKEKFKLVFETEKGSTYFVSRKGESWRFKKDENGEIDYQPILKKIFFISRDEAQRIFELRKDYFFQEKIIGFQMKKTDFAEGVVPVEMWIENSHQELFFEETDNTIKIVKIVNGDGREADQFAAGIHVGHPVSKIWKK